jgi:VanZ family protein
MWFSKYHLPAILYAALIIALSSIQELPESPIRWAALDKIAHFLEYSVLALLVFRSYSQLGHKVNLTRAYLLTLLSVTLFAVLDEYYQSFVPGRTMAAGDLLMDICGAFLVATYWWLRRRRKSLETETMEVS